MSKKGFKKNSPPKEQLTNAGNQKKYEYAPKLVIIREFCSYSEASPVLLNANYSG